MTNPADEPGSRSVEDILNAAFNSVGKKSTPSQNRIRPDESGSLYEITGINFITLELTGNLDQARAFCAKNLSAWTFYQIWRINVSDQTKVLIEERKVK